MSQLIHQIAIFQRISIAGWSISIMLFVFIASSFLSGYFLHETSKLINSTFLATFRLLWTVSMAWVIFAFDNGSWKWISRIFNHKLWIPLGKLTLTMYLVHPIVIASRISSNKRPIDFEIFELVRTNIISHIRKINDDNFLYFSLFSFRFFIYLEILLLVYLLRCCYICAWKCRSVSFQNFSPKVQVTKSLITKSTRSKITIL